MAMNEPVLDQNTAIAEICGSVCYSPSTFIWLQPLGLVSILLRGASEGFQYTTDSACATLTQQVVKCSYKSAQMSTDQQYTITLSALLPRCH